MSHPHHAHVEHRKRSREEIAKAEIGHTDSTPAVDWLLTLSFLIVILAVPLLQTVRELPAVPQYLEVFRILFPRGAELRELAKADGVHGRFAAARSMNNRILRDINDYERELKDRDHLHQWLLPHTQLLITGWLRGGNEDAYCGRDGWLFYRRDIDSLTQRAFLDPDVLHRRAASGSELRAPPQPDPIRSIVQFRDQLAARGIALIVMPAPVKPSIHPEFHSARYDRESGVVLNPSFHDFTRRLAEVGIPVFDASTSLCDARTREAVYLKTDTHWTPRAMELVAGELAAFARKTSDLSKPAPNRYTTIEKTVVNQGDLARMLNLPAVHSETVRVRQVVDGNRYWRPSTESEVLFLGDSFANIYSLEPMGWGEAAGLVEHLSLALGLPLDALTRNDAGAHATREMLAKELQRGNDRLAGKKLVIWEFAARELACGDWKLIPLALGAKREVGMYAPSAGKVVELRGVVRAASPAPRPGSVPYKDHIVMVHLSELESSDDPVATGKEAVAFVWSMRDNAATPAARYRPGDAVRLRVRRWADVAAKFEAINRSELDDETVLLAEPNWGEAIP